MKKKNIIITIIIVIALAVGIGGKVFFDNLKAQAKVYEVLDQLFNEKIKSEDINYKSLGKYENTVREIVKKSDKIVEDCKNLESEADNKEFERIMDAKYLNDPALGKQNIQKLSKKMLGYEELFKKDFKAFTDSMEKLPLSKKDKEELKKTFDTETSVLTKEMKSATEYLKGTFTRTETLFDYLVTKKGKYTVQGEQIMFNSKQDMDGYNKLINEFNNFISNQK